MREDLARPRCPAPQGEGRLNRDGSETHRLETARPGPDPTSHRVARNTLLSAVGEGSNLLLFLLGFLAARLLAPVAFGEYSTAFAFVGLFRILPDFGMSYASTLAISRDRSLAARLLGSLLGFQAILSIVALVLCLGIGRTQYTGVTWAAVVLLCLDLCLKALKSTLRWLLKSLERFGAEALSLLAERTAILTLATGAILGGYGVIGFVLAFLVVRLFDTSALYLWVHRRLVPLRPTYDGRLWWDLLRRGLPFAYAGAMITLFFQVDAVMLEHLRGPQEVGWYRAPVLVLEGLTLVPRILSYALIPTMAALHLSSPETVTGLYRRGSKYLVLAGLPIAAFGLLCSATFIPFLFGKDYAPSAHVATILLPAAVFMFLSNFGETTLACIDRWRTIVVVSTLALALNIALNLLFIPRYGYVAAAWATLATEGAYFLMTAGALRAFGHRASWGSLLLRPVLATLAFAAILGVTRSLPLLAASVLASLGFVAATFVFGVWDTEEKTVALSFLGAFLRSGRPSDTNAG